MRNQNKSDPRAPLTRDEILAAIRASGYPFEVKLMRKFKDAGINAGEAWEAPDLQQSDSTDGDGTLTIKDIPVVRYTLQELTTSSFETHKNNIGIFTMTRTGSNVSAVRVTNTFVDSDGGAFQTAGAWGTLFK